MSTEGLRVKDGAQQSWTSFSKGGAHYFQEEPTHYEGDL